MIGVGKQDLAIRSHEVAGQGGATTGVVDPAEDVTTQPCGGHRGQHVGGVSQQSADVQWPAGIGDTDQRGGLGLRIGKVFAPCPLPLIETNRDRRVAQSLAQQLLDGLRR